MRTRTPWFMGAALVVTLAATAAGSRLGQGEQESFVTPASAQKVPARRSQIATPDNCATLQFHDTNTNELYLPEMGLDLVGIFGASATNGIVTTPLCASPVLNREIVVPVLMVDWEDFDPRTDPSNENNPDSTFPDYVAKTPEEISAYMNGPNGPAQYYRDASGGQVQIRFEVIGWLHSDTPGSYLKPRSAYVSYNADVQQYQCKPDEIVLDAARDAVALKNVDFRDYDSDRQTSGNPSGVLDGLVLMYEGHQGMCSGTNVSGANHPYSHTTILLADGLDSASGWYNIKDLVPDTDANYSKFQAQSLLYYRYVNMAEQFADDPYSLMTTHIWAHEFGHLWLNYPDHYMSFHNFSYWVLSGHQDGQPAGWEKWLYGRWFPSVSLNQNGRYTLKTSDIARGSNYDNGTFLYQIPLEGVDHRYLTVENRWFKKDGNSADIWRRDMMGPNSGVVVMEFDWSHVWSDQANDRSLQIFRQAPFSEPGSALYHEQRGFRPRDVFVRCGTVDCVKLSGFTAPGAEVSFDFMRYAISPDDLDRDGVTDTDDVFPDNRFEWADSDHDGIGDNSDSDVDNDGHNDDVDAFPQDGSEWLDTDIDGIGNNADPDDDNDSVLDEQDAFSLNAAESIDTDSDSIGNNADTDDDNDGVADSQDAFPLDPTRHSQSSGDEGGGGGGGTVSWYGVLLAAGALLMRRQRQG